MRLQPHFCFELLLAELALVAGILLLFVSQQVVLKSRCVPELSRALVAGKRPLLFVDVHVLHQVEESVKSLVTDVTHKDSAFLQNLCFQTLLALGVFGLR